MRVQRAIDSATSLATETVTLSAAGSQVAVATPSNLVLRTSNVAALSNLSFGGSLYGRTGVALSVSADGQGLLVNDLSAYSYVSLRNRLTMAGAGAKFPVETFTADGNAFTMDMSAPVSAELYVSSLKVLAANDEVLPGLMRGDVVLAASNNVSGVTVTTQAAALATSQDALTLRGSLLGLGTANPKQRVHVTNGSLLLSQIAQGTQLAGSEPRIFAGSNAVAAETLRFANSLVTTDTREMFGVHVMVGSNDGFFAGVRSYGNAVPTPILGWGDATDLRICASPGRDAASTVREVARMTSSGALGLGTQTFAAGEMLAVAGHAFVGLDAYKSAATGLLNASLSRRLAFDQTYDQSSDQTPANKIRVFDTAAKVFGLGVAGTGASALTYHTASDHVFYTGSTQAAYGSNALQVSAVSGATRVHVGGQNGALTSTLNVTGDAALTSHLRLGTAAQIFAADGLGNAAGRFLLSNTGQVGVMTATPAAYLEVAVPAVAGAADPRSNGIAVVNAGTSVTSHSVLSLRASGTGGDAFVSLENAGVTGWSLGVHRSDGGKFKIAASSNSVATSTVMALTKDTGYAGIGTTAPATRLHLSGGGGLTVSGAAARCVTDATTTSAVVYALSNATTASALTGLGVGDNPQDVRLFAPTAGAKVAVQVAGADEVQVSTAGGLWARSNIASSNCVLSCNLAVDGRISVGGGLLKAGAVLSGSTVTSEYLSASNVSLRLDATGSNGVHEASLVALLPSGRLGVGTSTPVEKLHVEGSIAIAGGNSILFRGVGNDATNQYHTLIAENLYGGVGTQASELALVKLKDALVASGGSDRIRHVAAQHLFQVYPTDQTAPTSAADALGRSYTQAMIINSNAYVGIGTAQPAQPLEVVGNLSWRNGSLMSNNVALPTQNLYAFSVLDTPLPATIASRAGYNVGIGVTTTAYTLDVQGSFRLNATATTTVMTQDGTATGPLVVSARAHAAGNMSCAGLLALGTSATQTFTPSNVLHVTSGNVVLDSAAHTLAAAPGQWLEFRKAGTTGVTGNPRFTVATSLSSTSTPATNRMFLCYNDVGADFGAGGYNDAYAKLVVRGDGNVGVGVADPQARFHASGTSYLYGRVVVNDATNGDVNRGINLWSPTVNSWGVYVAGSAVGKSFAGATACAGWGTGFTSNALRLRVHNSTDVNNLTGLIVENAAETLLMSVNGNTGDTYVKGSLSNSGPLSVGGAAVVNGALNMLTNTLTCGSINNTGTHTNTGNIFASTGLGVGMTTFATPSDGIFQVAGNSRLDGRIKVNAAGTTGGTGTGIQMWSDTSCGIYVAMSGAALSLAGTTSASLNGVGSATAKVLRLRCSSTAGEGLIIENSADLPLVSVTGATGDLYTRGASR